MAVAAGGFVNWDHFTGVNAAVISVVSVCAFFVYQRRKQSTYPPCYSGWLPWIGCAVEFGKAPLMFIERARNLMGPIFTLKVAGKRLTFITEVDDFKHFFLSNNVDFQKAVQQPVKNTANVTVESFFENHTKVHDAVKGRLAPALLGPFCKSLCERFDKEISQWGASGSQCELASIVRGSMYRVVLDNLFGHNVLPTVDQDKFQELERHFVKFDEDFEYGAQLPEFFLKDWSKSKWWLLNVFNLVVSQAEKERGPEDQEVKERGPEDQETVFHHLIRMVDRPHAPNYAMLLMWASLANAIPMTFWTLAFIWADPELVQELKAEVGAVLKQKSSQHDLDITEADLSEMPSVKRCILETIRLRTPGVITRGVSRSFTVRGYTVPEGDLLMLSPYWAHRNPRFFPEPDSFKPDRWKVADLDKNGFLEGFVAFGGGRYQCPGRWFALLEMQLFVALVMYRCDIRLLAAVPPPSTLHVVGTQQPVGPLPVGITPVIPTN